MKRKIQKYIKENNMLDGVKTVVIGVSGGADSMALADFMVKNYPSYQYTFAHVNHSLREEADDDGVLVRKFAENLGVKFQNLKVDVGALAKKRKIGIEEAGREVRYDFFRSLNADLTLTAHHKDDRAETIIAHIIRGTGIKGLKGIEPLKNKIARPFLCVSKYEIVSYCEENNIAFAEDLSNEDVTFQRNKIRHEVMPLLASMNPNIIDSLCRLGDIATEDEMFLDSLAQSLYTKAVVVKDGSLFMPNQALDLAEKSIGRRLVGKLGNQIGCSLDFSAINKILTLKTGKEFPLGKMGKVTQNGLGLVFLQEKEPKVEPWSVDLPTEGVIFIPRCNFAVEILRLKETVIDNPDKDNCVVVDGNWLSEPLSMRSWEQGDWFYLPQGGRKKVSDYFIDEKIPQEERLKIPLLSMGSQVLWIVGYRQCIAKGKGDCVIKIKL